MCFLDHWIGHDGERNLINFLDKLVFKTLLHSRLFTREGYLYQGKYFERHGIEHGPYQHRQVVVVM